MRKEKKEHQMKSTVRNTINNALNKSDLFSLRGIVNLDAMRDSLREKGFVRIPTLERLKAIIRDEAKQFSDSRTFFVGEKSTPNGK
jgi:hypothetical protein